MKRIVCILLILTNVFLASSCGGWDVDDPKIPDVTEEAADIIDPSVVYERVGYDSFRSSNTAFLEGANGLVLFYFNHGLFYYNPVSGKCHPFCFDPSCKHLYNQCVRNKMRLTNCITYEDGQIYAAFVHDIIGDGDMSGIARISHDATSIEVLYRCQTRAARRMYSAGGYLFILMANGSSNTINRYDISTGEMVQLEGSKGNLFKSLFIVTEDKLFYSYRGDTHMYCSDFDMQNEKELFPQSPVVSYKNKLYHLENIFAEDGRTRERAKLYEYDLTNDVDRFIGEFSGKDFGSMWGADSKYLYYSPYNDKTFLSDYNGKERRTDSGGVLCRLDLETGESKMIFESPKLDIQEVFEMNGRLYMRVKLFTSNTWLGYSGLLKYVYGELADFDGDGEDDLELKLFEWELNQD